MKQSFIKKIMYVVGVLASLVVLAVLFLFISSLKKPSQTPTPVTQKVPKDTTTQLIKAVLPDSSQSLTPSQNQTFTITLDPSLDPNAIQPKLTVSPPSNAAKKTDVPLTATHENNRLVLATTQPILPTSTYTLTLTLRGQIILQQSFLSAAPSPTPLPANNTMLSRFLPHETHIYLLEFDRDQNIYLMHFKYDAGSPESFTDQFEKAKRSTNEFISSKGIDPATVIIKYLYK
jgi:hypothetical protein